MREELDEDGMPLRTARAIQAERAKLVGQKMLKRSFANQVPEWPDVSRPTYDLSRMLGGEARKIDYLKDVKMQKSKQLDYFKKKENFVFVERSYNWLMIHLLSHHESIQGCEVSIPEQVLFFD